MQRIAIGADHGGFVLKTTLIDFLQSDDHVVIDVGAFEFDPLDDHPPICAEVGRQVAAGEVRFGIVLGGSGQGEQISANKIHGVRAALCNDLYLAELARRHNDANVLSIGARVVADDLAQKIVTKFLTTEFEGGKYARRLRQITDIEEQQ